MCVCMAVIIKAVTNLGGVEDMARAGWRRDQGGNDINIDIQYSCMKFWYIFWYIYIYIYEQDFDSGL